ncbi:MAG: HlyD family efflux transporter periplasmic adaptor subunit [Candidatus Cloacimonetes bacterium]|nr:HlyD family efflux transporter periplasmic adaptor subunit [Candidatus Cloacimonadota bacterium]
MSDSNEEKIAVPARIGTDTYSSILDEIPQLYYRAPVFVIASFCFCLIIFLFVFDTQRVIYAHGKFISKDSSIAVIADYDCNISKTLVKVGDKITKDMDIFVVEPILGTDNPKLLKKKIFLLKHTIKNLQQGERILNKIDRNFNMISSYQSVVIENPHVNDFISKLLKIHIRLSHLNRTVTTSDQITIELLEIEKKQVLSNLNNVAMKLQLELDDAKSILNTYQNNLQLLQDKIYNSYIKSPQSGVVIDLSNKNNQTITNGQIVARVLPSSASLIVHAKVPSAHIHLIDLGNKVYIKVKSYPYQKFGVLSGVISKISPDLGDAGHFVVEIQADKTELSIDNTQINMYPGLLCDIEILTKKQAVINFFLKIKHSVGEI